jgi:chromate transporter
MITPGPVVITVAFIGYLVAGMGGAIAAGIGVFLPVYLFVVIPYPWFDKWSANSQVRAFVKGVTAAAAGAIAGACFVLGRRAVFDLPTAALAAGTLLLLSRFKIPEPVLIVAAGLIGMLAFWLKGHP